MTTGSDTLLSQLGLLDRTPPDFLRHVQELDETERPLPQAHAVRRAWRELGLCGVLYVAGSPAAYLKEVDTFRRGPLRSLLQRLWNHGCAPLLIAASPTQVRVYSGLALPPAADEDPHGGDRLVELLDRTADLLKLRDLVRSIETGHIYAEKPRSFNPGHAVDRCLLRHLSGLRWTLVRGEGGLQAETVHALLTRLVFTCYLVERKVISGNTIGNEALSGLTCEGGVAALLKGKRPEEALELLYLLFGSLQDTFNGSMFDIDLDSEKGQLRPQHMKAIQQFLRGDDPVSGQLSLGWRAYDFSMIPVETISAVYEDFIGAEATGKRRRTGAYYTPPHLVELVIDTAVEGWLSLLDKRVLDPACGSGIFLVSVFNRMAEEWRRKHPHQRNLERADALTEILREQLFGIDVSETACRIACFSLCLALLDQLEPRDIAELRAQGRPLPRLLLSAGETVPEGERRSVICGDLFDPALPLPKGYFDLVVGNPPWVARGQSRSPLFLQWIRTHAHLPVPQKQLAHGFMWEVPQHLTADGHACLLLPTAVLTNRTDRFQQEWFSRFTVEKVIQLSDMRFLFFVGASHPAVVVRFNCQQPDIQHGRLDYLVPKTDNRTLRGGPVVVRPVDHWQVQVKRLLARAGQREAPVFWKRRLWGTPRDLRLLDRLEDMPRLGDLAGRPSENKRWLKGQGFQPIGPSDTDPEKWIRPDWEADGLFLPGDRDLSLILLREECEKIGEDEHILRRLPNEAVCEPPLVVVSQGFSKVAFSSFRMRFQDSLQAISGPPEDADALMFLTAVLASSVAKYFLFHTAANWGTEREKVQFFELLRMPFPLPEQTADPGRAAELMDQVVGMMRQLATDVRDAGLGRQEAVGAAKRSMAEPIYAYYDVDKRERMLIEDTVSVFEPSSTPHGMGTDVLALQKPTRAQRRAYVATLCGLLNTWARRHGHRVSGSVTYSHRAGAAVVTLQLDADQCQYTEDESTEGLSRSLARMMRSLPERAAGVEQLRDLKVFDREVLYILKPLILRAWTRTAALNDADDVAGEVIGSLQGAAE